MTMLARIAEKVINRPLLVHPQKAEVILWVLGERIGVDRGPAPGPEANRFFGQPKVAGRSRMYGVIDGAAVITIEGSLVNRGEWIGADSGLTAYEGIEAQIETALADANVQSIVLDIDSPGGEATGMSSLARSVRTARQAKPVVALVNDVAASAAYGIASQADRILVSPTSLTGSIGVVLLHLDRSGEMAMKGIVPTFVYAGAHKVDGHPFGPLPDGVRADLQREVAVFYDEFVRTVALGRGARLDETAARATEARVFIGAEAIDRGLADSVGGLREAVVEARRLTDSRKSGAGLAGRPSGSNPLPAPAAGPTEEPLTMEWKDLTAEGLRQNRPDLIQAIEGGHDISAQLAAARQEGAETAGPAAAKAERERIAAIQAAAFAGQETLAAELIADGRTTAAEAALRFNQDLKAKGPDHVAALRAMDAHARVPANPTGGASAATTEAVPQTDDGWKAEFNAQTPAGAALRAEFGAEANYLAFKRADAGGKVRILKR